MSRMIRPKRWSSAIASWVMRKGAIAQIGTSRDIYFAPQSRFVAEFIGAANIIEAPLDRGQLVLPGGRLPIGGDASLPAAVAMIRPETIGIVDVGAAPLTGIVDSVSFTGNRQRIVVSGVADKPLAIDAPNLVKAKAGDRIGLAISAEAVRLFAAGRLNNDVQQTNLYCPDFRPAHQVARAIGLWPRGYGESAGALRRGLERVQAGAGLRCDIGRPRRYADIRGNMTISKQMLSALKLPFAGIPGNHDSRDMMRAAFPQIARAVLSGALNQKIEVGRSRSAAAGFKCAGQAPWQARSVHLAMARRNAGRLNGQARTAVPASSAVHRRHLAYGSTEPGECR